MKKVIINKTEYDLEDKDVALIEIIRELTMEIKSARFSRGRFR